MKHTLLVSIAALMGFTACTQDDISYPAGTSPLTLTAAIEGEATTRATVDGTWEAGNTIALKVDGDDATYTYTVADAGGNTLSGDYYWKSTDPITVQGFYPFEAAAATEWEVNSQQNSKANYQGCDLLVSQEEPITWDGKDNASLTFYHQTAKVVVHVKNEGYLANNWNHGDVSMTIGENDNINLSGTFTPFTGVDGTAGTWSDLDTPGTIIPHEAATAANCAASFEALVIPQNITAGTTLFQFKVGDADPFRYTVPEAGITWETGKVYTYNITLKAENKTVTVNSVEPGNWGDGGSHSLTTE